MGIFRTYFDKDTTIIRNSCVNTGRNPIIELYHGGSTDVDKLTFTRYIFDVDLSIISGKTVTKDILNNGLTHTLKITNTSAFDVEKCCPKYSSVYGEANRSTGFDLILFKVPQNWVEGTGYDYVYSKTLCDNTNKTYCEGPTNWFNTNEMVTWYNEGIYSGDPTTYISSGATGTTSLIIGTQHFPKGNENINIDITDYINSIIFSGETNYGLGVAFEYPLEMTTNPCLEYVGFFGKETNTVYEPYIETTWDDLIQDDRNSFYLDKTNNLCLYVNAGGQSTNLDTLPSSVTIIDHNENEYTTIPQSGITQVSRGVYCVSVNVPYEPTSGYCGNIMFNDVWSGISINNRNLGDITMDFIVRDSGEYFSVGSTNESLNNGLGVNGTLSIYDYKLSFSGIKRREKIKRGDTRRVNVDALIPFSLNKKDTLDQLYYRIFIKEGQTQIDYIGWTDINRAVDGNFFIVDTSWFITNDYFLEVKVVSGNETKTFDDILQFEIVNEKTF